MISDWEGIDRITSPPHANYSYSIEAGVGAGIDMVRIRSVKHVHSYFFLQKTVKHRTNLFT